MRSISPMKIVVVCNSDVPWGKEIMPWWAGYHDVFATVVEFPFGTDCLDHTRNIRWASYDPGSRENFYNRFIRPVQAIARDVGAHGVFMGPGTPMQVRLPDSSGTMRYISLPAALACIHGFVRLVENFGYPLPSVYGPWLRFDDAAMLPELGFVREPNLVMTVNNSFKYYGGQRVQGNQQEYQSHYGAFVPPVTGWPGLVRLYKGQLGFVEEELETFSPIRKALYAEPMLVGRFGKPVFHSQSSPQMRAFVGDETLEDAIKIFNGSLTQQKDIAGHRDQPIWIGVSNRNAGMTDLMCAAAIDVARRAGFTNINFFTRSINSITRSELEKCIRLQDRVFTFSQVPQQPTRDCFLYLGYGLHNEVPGRYDEQNSAGELRAIQGAHIDRLFHYLPGSLVFAGTSFPCRHVARNLKDGGAGGISCEYEPGFRAQPATLLYNLLKGCRLAEAHALTNELIGSVSFPVGDPIYAPFKHESGEGENWYATMGAPFHGA